MNYIKHNSTDESNQLLILLKENYPGEFTNASLLNTVGNLLLRLNENLEWALINIQLYPKDGNLFESLG